MNKIKTLEEWKVNIKYDRQTKVTDKIYKIYFYTNFSTSAPKDDPQL